MQCPRCGVELPESGVESCDRCGFVPRPAIESTAPVSTTPDGDEERLPEAAWKSAAPGFLPVAPATPIVRPIGRTSRSVRAVAAFGAIGVGVMLFLNGAALEAFAAYLMLVFFVGVGLYGLVTLASPISVRRFGWEMVVLVGATVTLKLVFPDAFAIERSGTRSAAGAQELAGEAGFVAAAEGYLRAGSKLLEATDKAGEAGLVAHLRKVDVSNVGRHFATIPAERQVLFHPVWQAARDADARLVRVQRELQLRTSEELQKTPAQLRPDEAASYRASIVRLRTALDDLRKRLEDEAAGAAATP